MLLEPEQRGVSQSPDWYDNEKWWIFYDEDTNKYCIHVDYDCAYAATVIEDIKYCPLCGRELE
jgi:hypothetical protein